MTSAYFAPLVVLPNVIDGPGEYVTRSGEHIHIESTRARIGFNWTGKYADGRTKDYWHKSGRILASRETKNDIVSKA